ncbi:type II CRISPR RNA-guided endonuclease Cas9 [Levilactobacillus brevis]|nr:type II CRISPR RNA-guided endonuclease Cas9 [Levilactobacillus brevis]
MTDLRQITSDPARIDQIGTILTTYKGDAERQKRFQKLGLTPNQIDQLLPINATGFGHLSLKTMRAILPYLADGEVYSEAATHAGYDFRDNKIDREYLRENITNPVVNRAIAKTLKVVHAVIAEYGKPDAIHIELTRELRHSHDERKKIDKRRQANQEKNQRVANQLTENGIPVTGINIIKQKLFDEQGGIDLYSGNQINAEKLFSDQLFEIDHIIPYSKSFDDSFTNKVVTATHNNQSKADRTP